MDAGFRLVPESASSIAEGIDDLTLLLLAVTALFSVLIFVLVVVFAVRYRRRPGRERATPVANCVPLEIGWMLVPLALSMVIFVWGARLFVRIHQPPAGAIDVYVVAKQWMWKLQHPEGAVEINELHVPLGAVRLTMTSEDVIHSFFVPAFRLKQDVLPNRYTTLWFQATKPGTYPLFCAEYCGTKHSGMTGRVVVMTDTEYERWLASRTSPGSLSAGGYQLFLGLGCAVCHTGRAGARGPELRGLFGSTVLLEDGRSVLADEIYLRESIVDPKAKIVYGFQPVMPIFRGQVSEEQLIRLVAYLKSLSGAAGRTEDR